MKNSIILPKTLLDERLVPPIAKLMYAITQIYHPTSITELAQFAGISRARASRLCDYLVQQGWVVKSKKGVNIVPLPAIPPFIQEQMAKDLHVGYSASSLKGEYLIKAWLNYLLLTDDYVDNPRPSFLQNPLTGELMELDRFIPSLNTGIEYHGPQHFSTTRAFPDKAQFEQRRARDLMKQSLCQENGINLIVFTAEDLTLEKLLAKLPRNFPIRQVDLNGPYIKALERLSAEYRAGLTRAMARETRGQRNRPHQSQQ